MDNIVEIFEVEFIKIGETVDTEVVAALGTATAVAAAIVAAPDKAIKKVAKKIILNCNQVNNEKENSNKNEINWLLDSGCTDHIVNTDEYYSEYLDLKEPVTVNLGDGRLLKATKIGNIDTYFEAEIKIKNVYYVKEMKSNLLSYAKITENNKIVSIGDSLNIYNKFNNLVAIALKVDRLYKMTSKLINVESSVNCLNSLDKNNITLKEKWHPTLGHVNFKYLNTLCKNQLLNGLPTELESEFMKCKICIENKMHNLPFKNNRTRAREILQIVHTDLNGPHATTGYCGEKYFLSFVDDYSKLARVYTIKSKDEVYDCLIEYVNEVENLTGKRIKRIRCDNGTEYLNKRIYKFLRERGIRIDPCPPYIHELNGTAERFNRSVMDMSRCLLAEAKVHRRFWPEVVRTAAYLKNRSLANTIELKSPYEIFFGKKPNVENLRVYGNKVFVRLPEQKRDTKWDRKDNLGILLGYSEVGYRVLLNNKVVDARHVEFLDENVKCIGLDDDDDNDSLNTRDENLKDNLDMSKDHDLTENVNNIENETNNKEAVEPRRSSRNKKRSVWLDDNYIYNNVIYVNNSMVDTPYSNSI